MPETIVFKHNGMQQQMSRNNNAERTSTLLNELHREICRFHTFVNWPKHDIVSPEHLARYGFYYAGFGDVVKCYFCLIELGGWEPGDVVVDEHLRWSNYCPLMTRRPTNNEPINDNFLDNLPERAYDTVGISRQQLPAEVLVTDEPSISRRQITEPVSTAVYNNQVLAGASGISLKRPKHSRYVLPVERSKTFEEWPTGLTQRPEQMVDAGFFYTGTGDQVTCYSCGGRLKGWEPNDDPWEEHAKYYGDCSYVQLHKGREFIDKCQGKEQPTDVAVNENPTGKSVAVASSSKAKIERKSTIEAAKSTAASNGDPSESRMCKVCYENDCNTAFIPCGHVVACTQCAAIVERCPMCNEPFTHVFRVFLS